MLTAFLAVLLVVLAGYTEMAMQMEWRTEAGRIGAGFFPRIVGFSALALCLVAAVQSLRPRAAADGREPLGTHPGALLLVIGACVAFLVVLVPLGAIVTSTAFLLGVLWFLDRGRPVRNVTVAVLLPVALYLLFQTLLNSGLPRGILPML